MKTFSSYCYLLLLSMGFFIMHSLSHAITPEDLADTEIHVWKAYYGQDPSALKEALKGFIQNHYAVPNSEDLISAYSKVLITFAQTPQDASQETYEKSVLPLLEEVFNDFRKTSPLPLNPKEGAKAELCWWIARRGTADEYNPQNVGMLMETAYVLLYGGKMEDYRETALLRATAARHRDDYWESLSHEGLTDTYWGTIKRLLIQAYSHFPIEKLTPHP